MFVHFLKIARSKLSMDLDSCANDAVYESLCYLIQPISDTKLHEVA